MSRKVTIVTGASEGIGRAIVDVVARGGSHVVAIARRAEPLDAAVAAVRDAGGSAEAIVADASDPERLAAVVAAVGMRHGRLDGLVNNAHYFDSGFISGQGLSLWRQHFVVNCDAPFAAMQAAFPLMAAGEGGSIVNIASLSALRATPGTAAYGASKAALLHLGAIAAVEGARLGVRVNSVCPGAIATPGLLRTLDAVGSDARAAIARAASAQRRFGSAPDVAEAVDFLLSDRAAFVTGAELRVDGGGYWIRGADSQVSWTRDPD